MSQYSAAAEGDLHGLHAHWVPATARPTAEGTGSSKPLELAGGDAEQL